MKILQLTSSLAIGGVTSVVSNLSHALMHDYDVTIGCYKPNTDEITIDTDGLTIKHYSGIKDFYDDVKSSHYDVIHFHVMLKSGILALIAHLASKDTLLVTHAHSSQYNKKGLVFKVYEGMNRDLIHRYVNLKLGCSDLAGNYLYPKDEFITVNNAIDSSKFTFDPNNREVIRNQLGFTKADFVVGYVGQFNTVKNIPFLIEAVHKARNKDPNIKLLLVGGPMNDVVKPYVEQYSWIKTTGLVTDTYRYYSAFDCFALSSLWEGMPMVALEAQANGLKCCLTDTITHLLNVDNLVEFLPLEIHSWSDKFIQLACSDLSNRSNRIQNTSFDVQVFSKRIEELYIKNRK